MWHIREDVRGVKMELDGLSRLLIIFFYIELEMFSLQLMSSYLVYVLFFIVDAWFRTMSLFMDIDLLYYCTHLVVDYILLSQFLYI